MEEPVIHKKVIILGDSGSCKTSLGVTLKEGGFPTEYVPVCFENMSVEASKDGVKYSFNMWDVTCGEDGDRVHLLAYPQSDLCVLLYPIDSPTSHKRITSKWIPELVEHLPGVPWVLVATKIDLREHQPTLDRLNDLHQRGTVTTEEGQDLASRHGASGFVEVSPLTGYGMKECLTAWLDAFAPTSPTRSKSKPSRPGNNDKTNESCILQ